ncbi:MAG: hypothetical protein ACK44W_09315, partial [Planctomycetota bacterium]
MRTLSGAALIVSLAGLPASADESRRDQELAVRKALEEFKAAMQEARGLPEKAQALRKLGEFQPRDAALVPPIARYLAPGSGDLHHVLPLVAVETLEKFRGVGAASQALMAALPAYRKNPYLYARLVTAIGRVGHELALSLFEEATRGKDAEAAAQAVWAVASFPPPTAAEWLLREADRLEKARDKGGDDARRVADRVLPEIVKALRKVTGEPYTTLMEMRIWWQKRGADFKARAKEPPPEAPAESNAKEPAPTRPPDSLPPVLLVELLFRENGGTATANTGCSSSHYPAASIVGAKLPWSGTTPPNGGPAALDWNSAGGPFSADIGSAGGIEHLKNLKSLTIAGWINCRSEREIPGDKAAPAGNRLVTWLNHGRDGVELVHRADGSLQLGINQWAADSKATSGPGRIPVLDEKAQDLNQALNANWRFFAVTYDSTASSGHVKFYFGSSNADAKLEAAVDYPRGPVGSRIGQTFSVGNVNLPTRSLAPDRSFKGLIDEVRVFGSAFDGSGALTLPEIIRLQDRQRARN